MQWNAMSVQPLLCVHFLHPDCASKWCYHAVKCADHRKVGKVLLPKALAMRHRSIREGAPEIECIGKGKAHRPYEFGVKVSVATTLSRAKGGQFVTHAKSLPGNPYDGHTLKTVIPEMEALIGNIIERLLGDKGYRGHNAPPEYKFRVFTS